MQVTETAAKFASRWVDAWKQRQLAPLLSLFSDDADYKNSTLNVYARGKKELTHLFAKMLHDCDGTIALQSVQEEGRKVTVTWVRTCTRVLGYDGNIHTPSCQTIRFAGLSRLEIVSGRVQVCLEDWFEYLDAIQRLLFERTLPAASIIVKDNVVCLGGVRIARRRI